ncbi:hypothetical protein [Bifidobacterium pseudolongum]|uniref:hypothetical protein n=1 Tax=Bifidobacterium pseudolongum TaxID=1694 RepID=UPI001020DE19|nr:hypothetical protein [Bifidobacterium pseudolongum]RYQ44136.1 hypothetical protein PG1791B_1288 [Bifidobacterium pseudolongum subsp. globosum]
MSNINTMPIPPMPSQQPGPTQHPGERTANTVNKTLLIIGGVLYAVYLLAVFLFLFPVTSGAITSIVFATLAFAMTFVMPAVIRTKTSTEAVFFGIPLIGFTSYYFFAELVVSFVFILFQLVIPFNVSLFIQIALLAAYVVVMAISLTAQRTSQRASDERHAEARNWNMQTVEVQSLLNAVRARGGSAQVTTALAHLEDVVRYSDPFSRAIPAVQNVEQRIGLTMQQLQQASALGDEQGELAIIAQLESLYAERGAMLKTLK